jgi:hypothetical protein
MAPRPGFTARALPAQTITVVGPADRALSTIESELLADGWHERVRVTPTGVVYQWGSAARAFWFSDLLPGELLPRRARRSVEYALAAAHARQQGERAILDVGLLWRETSTLTSTLQDEFRTAVDRTIARFHAASILISVGPVVSAYTLPRDNFCSPANRRAHLRAGRRRNLST